MAVLVRKMGRTAGARVRGQPAPSEMSQVWADQMMAGPEGPRVVMVIRRTAGNSSPLLQSKGRFW